MDKISDEVLRVVAKAFFADADGEEDYPHLTWQGQFDEFKKALAEGGVSKEFILQVYEWNKDRFEQDLN